MVELRSVLFVLFFTSFPLAIYANDVDIDRLQCANALDYDSYNVAIHTAQINFYIGTFDYQTAIDTAQYYLNLSTSPIEDNAYLILMAKAHLFQGDLKSVKPILDQIEINNSSLNLVFFDYYIVLYWLAKEQGNVDLCEEILHKIESTDLSLGPTTIGRSQILQRAGIYMLLRRYSDSLQDLALLTHYRKQYDSSYLFNAAILVFQEEYSNGIEKLEFLLSDKSYTSFCRSYIHYLLSVCYFKQGDAVKARKHFSEAYGILPHFDKPFLIDLTFHMFPEEIISVLNQIQGI